VASLQGPELTLTFINTTLTLSCCLSCLSLYFSQAWWN